MAKRNGQASEKPARQAPPATLETVEPAVRDEDSGVIYQPWVFRHCIGYKATHPDGRVQYIYLAASLGSDDGVPTVFVYQGTAGDHVNDAAVHHYVLFEEA